jgi:adenine-specific DNA-methyltransferase
VIDGKTEHVSREPEVIKAFRDTWSDGINTYLGYLRDRIYVARELLSDSGSLFLQIGDENVHMVRSVIDEIFSPANHVAELIVRKTTTGDKQIHTGDK